VGVFVELKYRQEHNSILIEYLTVFFPLSLNSGVPIVPLRFTSSSYQELKTWDRKKFARPFSTIEMIIGESIRRQGYL
jgi:hypothetical protein